MLASRALACTLVASALALAACGEGGEPRSGGAVADTDLLGTWSGTLHQKGFEPFEIGVTIASLDDPAKNRVRYTVIDCGGTWRFLGETGGAFEFRELIDSGAGSSCKGSGTVSLTTLPSPDRLLYAFRGGGVESRGTISRAN